MDKQEPDRYTLLVEGFFLYQEIEREHFDHSSYQKVTVENGETVGRTIPLMLRESAYIALALYARKKGIMEAVNNV